MSGSVIEVIQTKAKDEEPIVASARFTSIRLLCGSPIG